MVLLSFYLSSSSFLFTPFLYESHYRCIIRILQLNSTHKWRGREERVYVSLHLSAVSLQRKSKLQLFSSSIFGKHLPQSLCRYRENEDGNDDEDRSRRKILHSCNTLDRNGIQLKSLEYNDVYPQERYRQRELEKYTE